MGRIKRKHLARVLFCLILSISLIYLSDYYRQGAHKILDMFTARHEDTLADLFHFTEEQLINNTAKTDNLTFAPLCSRKDRIQSIKSICQQLNRSTQRNPGLLIQPEAKVGYCEISKVGSTNMKRVFATSTKAGRQLPRGYKPNWHNGNFLRKMGLTWEKGLTTRIANLTTFFIVRHPFDRLISAYNSKLGPNSLSGSGFGDLSRRIIQINNPNMTSKQIARRNKATFAEFIHALTSRAIAVRNNHWIPFAHWCNPCQVDYDYILRIESLTYDAQPIMRKLNVSPGHVQEMAYTTNKRLRYKEPTIITNKNAYAVFKRLEPFKDVPKSEITVLKKMYALDLKLYGYTFDEDSVMPGCAFSQKQCC